MGDNQVFIPPRFQEEVQSHLLLNYAEQINYPLILGIFGPPGNGKTFQLRTFLRNLGVSVQSISAADLESERAGVPGKLVVETYVMAASEIKKGNPAAIVIDDFDTTVGEWEHNTGTVNHQQIIAQIMHLADNPTHLERIGIIKRVPIFLTGNDFSKLYSPLKRPGRMLSFYWSPNPVESEEIATRILDFLPLGILRKLISTYPTAPISFYTEIRIRLLRDACSQLVKRQVNMKPIVENPERFKKYILASFDPVAIEPSRVFSVAQQIIEVTQVANKAHLEVYRS
ncbi:MAG TPA: AAA family ATPase [Cyclobacteriaceae bacterium]|nr:AAA family ATPase [Cyclobacteriaceae bacterium]